jgi:hypothetical protein
MYDLFKIFLWIVYQSPVVALAEMRAFFYVLFMDFKNMRICDQYMAVPVLGAVIGVKTVRLFVVREDSEGRVTVVKRFYDDECFLHEAEENGFHFPLKPENMD